MADQADEQHSAASIPLRERFRAWQPALMWGAGVALAHRLLLALWMAGAWLLFGGLTDHPIDFQSHALANLPPLAGRLQQLLFGVWRRWDVIEYLNLAQNGYRAIDPHASVYSPLTPLGIRLIDLVLPGGIDLAGMVFGTLSFALALALLYRVVEVFYGDAGLAPYAVATCALLPLAYFSAPPCPTRSTWRWCWACSTPPPPTAGCWPESAGCWRRWPVPRAR